MFQSLSVSHDPLANIVPILLKATEVTDSLCPYKVAISVFVSMFQSLIVLSFDPLANIVPILLKATEAIRFLCPYKIPIYVCVSMFQSLIE